MIHPKRYALMAEVIRSGQVPEADIDRIIRENPQFAGWYVETMRSQDAMRQLPQSGTPCASMPAGRPQWIAGTP